MKVKTLSVLLAGLASLNAGLAHAELPAIEAGGATFNLYGNVDEYLNFMRSSSGKSLNALEEGGYLRTRVGVRGEKPVDTDLSIKFQLEQGLNITNGSQADTTRLFDRQAWVGLKSAYGEFRAGRQNTAVFYRGSYIDFTARTMGSVINAFGVASRYDSDLAWISNRMDGLLLEAHYSFSGAKENETANQGVYQLAADYENGPFRVGYAGVGGKSPYASSVDKTVFYNNLYANYDYGRGKVYLAYVRTNNNASTCTNTNSDGSCKAGYTLNNGGSPLGNTGALVTGTSTGAYTYYNIWQVSADYKLTPKLRLGALYGRIEDSSNTGKNANGWAVGAYYDIFKDTMIYALVDVLSNDPNAGFRPSGSAGLPKNYTAASDVNGETIRGMQLGFVYKF
jgi:predicted porin